MLSFLPVLHLLFICVPGMATAQPSPSLSRATKNGATPVPISWLRSLTETADSHYQAALLGNQTRLVDSSSFSRHGGRGPVLLQCLQAQKPFCRALQSDCCPNVVKHVGPLEMQPHDHASPGTNYLRSFQEHREGDVAPAKLPQAGRTIRRNVIIVFYFDVLFLERWLVASDTRNEPKKSVGEATPAAASSFASETEVPGDRADTPRGTIRMTLAALFRLCTGTDLWRSLLLQKKPHHAIAHRQTTAPPPAATTATKLFVEVGTHQKSELEPLFRSTAAEEWHEKLAKQDETEDIRTAASGFRRPDEEKQEQEQDKREPQHRSFSGNDFVRTRVKFLEENAFSSSEKMTTTGNKDTEALEPDVCESADRINNHLQVLHRKSEAASADRIGHELRIESSWRELSLGEHDLKLGNYFVWSFEANPKTWRNAVRRVLFCRLSEVDPQRGLLLPFAIGALPDEVAADPAGALSKEQAAPSARAATTSAEVVDQAATSSMMPPSAEFGIVWFQEIAGQQKNPTQSVPASCNMLDSLSDLGPALLRVFRGLRDMQVVEFHYWTNLAGQILKKLNPLSTLDAVLSSTSPLLSNKLSLTDVEAQTRMDVLRMFFGAPAGGQTLSDKNAASISRNEAEDLPTGEDESALMYGDYANLLPKRIFEFIDQDRKTSHIKASLQEQAPDAGLALMQRVHEYVTAVSNTCIHATEKYGPFDYVYTPFSTLTYKNDDQRVGKYFVQTADVNFERALYPNRTSTALSADAEGAPPQEHDVVDVKQVAREWYDKTVDARRGFPDTPEGYHRKWSTVRHGLNHTLTNAAFRFFEVFRTCLRGRLDETPAGGGAAGEGDRAEHADEDTHKHKQSTLERAVPIVPLHALLQQAAAVVEQDEEQQVVKGKVQGDRAAGNGDVDPQEVSFELLKIDAQGHDWQVFQSLSLCPNESGGKEGISSSQGDAEVGTKPIMNNDLSKCGRADLRLKPKRVVMEAQDTREQLLTLYAHSSSSSLSVMKEGMTALGYADTPICSIQNCVLAEVNCLWVDVDDQGTTQSVKDSFAQRPGEGEPLDAYKQ
ncbi:unnamed protein product [Amoebophrya sp. A120]|nr:unnamed protein product [Amoebophrya sp. A120]|eukprot:GSA120T00018058001.1